jgi:hypothetical protein
MPTYNETHTLEHFEDLLKVAILARIAELSKTSPDACADFAALRESSRLLPEHLVGLIEGLGFSGHLSIRANSTNNPFGILALTPRGQELLELIGLDAAELLALVPEKCKVSAPERSSRRGGRNQRSADASA